MADDKKTRRPVSNKGTTKRPPKPKPRPTTGVLTDAERARLASNYEIVPSDAEIEALMERAQKTQNAMFGGKYSEAVLKTVKWMVGLSLECPLEED